MIIYIFIYTHKYHAIVKPQTLILFRRKNKKIEKKKTFPPKNHYSHGNPQALPDPHKLLFVRAIRNGIQYWPRFVFDRTFPRIPPIFTERTSQDILQSRKFQQYEKICHWARIRGGGEPNKRSKWKKLLTWTGIDGARWKGALSSRKNGASSSPQGGFGVPLSARSFREIYTRIFELRETV